MNQYKHNTKKQSMVMELYALHEGSNEILEKYIPRIKKVQKSIYSKLDEIGICASFSYYILLVIRKHALDYIEMDFVIMIKRVLATESID